MNIWIRVDISIRMYISLNMSSTIYKAMIIRIRRNTSLYIRIFIVVDWNIDIIGIVVRWYMEMPIL